MIENHKISLCNLGWNEELEKEFKEYKEKFSVGRVSVEYKNMYRLYTEKGEILATISGKMNHNAFSREDYPAVGDWVVISKTVDGEERTIIHSILPRMSKFSRKVAGKVVEEQIVAVNVDALFICMSLNNDFNLRRLERYLTMGWDSGAIPVVILTKADLCDNIDEKIQEVESVAFGVNTHVISAVKRDGINELDQYLGKGKTVAFLGSSGVGKSTLINCLIGEERLATKEIREDDDRGRHTTTHRELILLPNGGLVLDTPGMREIHILNAEEGMGSTFEDIENLASKCKFTDCKHDTEPGCAVREAIEEGRLERKRFKNYLHLLKEAQYIASKQSKKEAYQYSQNQKKFWKKVQSNNKNRKKVIG